MNLLPQARSISAKLTTMNVLVSGTALLLACLSFLSYDLISFRQSLILSIQTEAQIIASNSASALLFDDPQAAESTLSALRNSPDIVSAVILSPDRHLFAGFSRDARRPTMELPDIPTGRTTFRWSQGRRVLLGSQIVFQGKTLGSLYLLAETNEIVHRAGQYLLIAALVIVLCMIVTLLVTSTFRRLVAQPLVNMADTARLVSQNQDYSLRANSPATGDELSALVDSFNHMLGQIQERDRALHDAQMVLEQKVKERTAELTTANQELEAFSGSVAHDLRGPLDVVRNLSYLLESSLGEEVQRQNASILRELPRATSRMSTLIDDLLNLAKAKSSAIRRQHLALSELVETIRWHLEMAEPERRVKFEIAPDIHGDADQGLMCIVLQNLIGNSWKYTSKTEAPVIEFGCTPGLEGTIYFVRDNGVGFDPRYSERLFQPFQRLHSSSDFAGTGIGLATVHRIITRHDGRIWAEGKPNAGATFFFTLNEGLSEQASVHLSKAQGAQRF